MTLKQLFMATNMDLNKMQAPLIKLYEFNYFANKAVNRYINKIYSAFYDINQQSTDDLRVLKSTVILKPNQAVDTLYSGGTKTYEITLPADYLHLLNCICVFVPSMDYMCYDAGLPYYVPAKKLTADSWADILGDIYNAPSALNPYYYIHNVNNYSDKYPAYSEAVSYDDQYDMTLTTDRKDYGDSAVKKDYRVNKVVTYYTYNGTTGHVDSPIKPDFQTTYSEIIKEYYVPSTAKPVNLTTGEYDNKYLVQTTTIMRAADGSEQSRNIITGSADVDTSGTGTYTNFPRTIKIKKNSEESEVSTIEKPGGVRVANPTGVRMEIRCGDTSICKLQYVSVDYIKAPQYLRLSQRQYDSTLDISLVLEFPDYICQEIENELLMIILEHMNDPRLPNTTLINLTIARPSAQQLQQPAPQQS